MTDDDIMRRQLSKFLCDNAVGKHHVGKYHYAEIMLSSGEKRNIRIEKGKVGRIAISREKIFNAINEWHRDGNAVKNIGTVPRTLFICFVNCVPSAFRRILLSSL